MPGGWRPYSLAQLRPMARQIRLVIDRAIDTWFLPDWRQDILIQKANAEVRAQELLNEEKAYGIAGQNGVTVDEIMSRVEKRITLAPKTSEITARPYESPISRLEGVGLSQKGQENLIVAKLARHAMPDQPQSSVQGNGRSASSMHSTDEPPKDMQMLSTDPASDSLAQPNGTRNSVAKRRNIHLRLP